MPCCDTGRNIQKYKGAAASTLQEALENGNTATIDIVLQSPAIFVGDGSGLSNIPGVGGSVGNLQQVTDVNATTTRFITLTNTGTSLQTSGSIVVGTNVHAIEYFGDGTTLTGVALSTDLASNSIRIGTVSTDLASNSTRIETVSTDLASNSTRIETVSTDLASNSTRISTVSTDLASNSTRITNLQNSTIISNSSGITDAFETGDLIYASGQNTLSNLSIGSTSQVLTVSGSGIPEWSAPSGGTGTGGGYWTQNSVNDIYYNSGNVGISNTAPVNTLDIGSNVSINDSASDVLSVRSGNTFIEKNLFVGGVITSPVGGSMKIDTMTVRSLNVKNMVVVAERPPKNIIIN